ncbi:hypothetical protein K503DRAFT_156568 [Rhizopogon vinicolor AM-OR11-026]|uniref:Uncharacterized protein n=1 Tax=Rhizopogon vinicolor AM-OR11-026 TaxID=1314800 RepID=A0A1B7N0V8_9AGAM|nr:hypothetical protein K503DRAFT_156568 [Rhizopogon vinicolor AM-OR11-026]
MAPKLISLPIFAIFLLAFLSLLACASPIPIVLPPSEGITLFKDVIAREALPEVDISTRDPAPALELHDANSVLMRAEDAEPDILVDDPEDELLSRICRYGCL